MPSSSTASLHEVSVFAGGEAPYLLLGVLSAFAVPIGLVRAFADDLLAYMTTLRSLGVRCKQNRRNPPGIGAGFSRLTGA
jgi:hypothetical protein